MQAEMEWSKLALMLRLLIDGWSPEQPGATDEAASFFRVGWVRRERGNIVTANAREIRERLELLSPGLEEMALAAKRLNLNPFTRGGHRMAARAAKGLPPMPKHISRKVAGAWLKPHSKHALSEEEAAAAGIEQLLGDGLFRIRSTGPLSVVNREGRSSDLQHNTSVYGEASLPERFLDRCNHMIGRPRAVIMVENAGAFTELPLPEGMVAVHVPGNDASATKLLRLLPDVPVLHFGDWDQRGREASRRVRGAASAAGCPFSWVCPAWLSDYIETHAMKVTGVPWRAPFDDLPEPVACLAKRGIWIEQEPLTLDSRLSEELLWATLSAKR
jgi:hypothetical protein